MEHIRQYDWTATEPDIHFLTEADVDNCVTEKILRNKFHDPLILSESEDEGDSKFKINWDEIFSKKKIDRKLRTIVQGLHPLPPFPKLSALTGLQHYQCLKILCSQNPDILPGEFIHRPTKQDHKVFEQVKEIYEKEQKEYIDWAKSIWTSNHCVRALRPKPPIEMVYEAEFKVRAHSLESFPKNYALAAQIPLDMENDCEMVHQKDIIKVNMSSLPQIKYPDMTTRVSIMKPCPVPEPCNKHPCRFVLPTDNSMTILPLTETHRELAQFALDNGATTIASENALRCLMLNDRFWTIPVSVCQVITADGEGVNVSVLGSEFSVHRETAMIRTYKAFRRLLEYTLVPPLEAQLARKRWNVNKNIVKVNKNVDRVDARRLHDDDSDDDADRLFIDTADDVEMQEETNPTAEEETESPRRSTRNAKETPSKKETANKIDFYNCTCKETPFERPPPRSYAKWRVKDHHTNDSYDIIVHCPHRVRGSTGEVILEPIPEYQIDVGARAQTPDDTRAATLALMLRKNATILNVRVDCGSGDVVTCDTMTRADVRAAEGDVRRRVATALAQLAGLLPGRYLLRHEAGHGSNALLYSARTSATDVILQFDGSQLADADEARSVITAPTLAPVLLPVHKFRKLLPCAFTPHANQLPREPRRPPARAPPPPHAIKWPKKNRGRKRKKNNNN